MALLGLLPVPKSVVAGKGTFAMRAADPMIVLQPHEASGDFFAARRLADQLAGMVAGKWRVARDVGGRGEIRCLMDAGVKHAEGYRIVISEKGIETFASTAAGTFYALQTVGQIFRSMMAGAKKGAVKVPCMTIEDWPDFGRRGVYLDVSRGKVPQLHTLMQVIDDLAGLKINEFQLYVENVFEFRRHPEMHEGTTPLTAEELMFLDEACRRRHIDFVPSLTSLGHFDKILSRPEFRKLAEVEPEELKRQGIKTWSDQPWSLCVTDAGARQLIDDMYDEFLPNFTSEHFNICCDESWDLGKGRSKELAEKIGVGQLYVDWVNRCAERARAHHRKIQMWGDIIKNHPELIGQLPADATMLEWGYEAEHDFAESCRRYAAAGRRFYVSPGTSSWMTLASRTKNACANIHAAATAGAAHGAAGLLNTDWGDHGHMQMFAVSMVALAYGAGASWNVGAMGNPVSDENNAAMGAFLQSASVQVFGDETGEFAGLAYELGTIYEKFGANRKNASMEWFMLREKWEDGSWAGKVEEKGMRAVEKVVKKVLPKLAKAKLGHAEGEQIVAEFVLTCAEILHGVRRNRARRAQLGIEAMTPGAYRKEMAALAKDVAGLAKEYRRLWLARNKTSRMEDMLEEFARLGREYKKFAKG